MSQPKSDPVCHHVVVQNMAFTPANVTAKVGDCVCWTFKEAGHSVVSDDGAFQSSDPMAVGSTFEFECPSDGSFPYHCAAMPSMTGVVMVN